MYPCSFSLPIFLTRAQTAECSRQEGRITRYVHSWKALKTRPGQDSHGGRTRCSTPQKLTYRVPEYPAGLSPVVVESPQLENCATRTVSRFPRVIPLALAANRCNERPGIIPTLFSDRARAPG